MALRNLIYYGQSGPIAQVEQNLIWYLRDELLKTGAYYNIASGFLGYNGEDLSLLRPSYQSEHSNFQFWAGLSHQWVWESGAIDTDDDGDVDVNTAYLTAPPISVSGVYMSGIFYPEATTTGAMAHYIDYSRGGVVFTNARASGTSIWCNRTERAVFVYSAHSDEYRQIVYEHLHTRRNNPPGSGIDVISPESKAILPAIFVSASQSNSVPYQLGNITNMTRFQINFDIVSEHVADLNKLRAVCNGLEHHTVSMFDIDTAATGDFPLDYLGRVRSSAKTRADLLVDHYSQLGRFRNDALDRVFPTTLPLHRARVMVTFEILL